MNQLTFSQRKLRNQIEDLNEEISTIQCKIKDLQKQCNHVWGNYPNPDVEVKYCMICGVEEQK